MVFHVSVVLYVQAQPIKEEGGEKHTNKQVYYISCTCVQNFACELNSLLLNTQKLSIVLVFTRLSNHDDLMYNWIAKNIID